MNTAEYIVKQLEELGINDIFGLPGDYNFNILYAIEENKNVNWVGCTNELNAGYAADGYARIRGYGALVTTYGVGELSAINAIAGSMAESVPVIHLVGIPATKFINNKTLLHHNLQDVDYKAFMNAFKSVTALTTLLNKDNAKLEIDRAIKTLVNEKKPVYIAIPDDIAQMEISERNPVYETISDRELLTQVAKKITDKIANSKRPVIIGDVLIKRFGATLEYKEFVEKSKVPVSNFIMGANIIPTSYELYLGGYFSEYRNPIAQKYIEETDCMIAVGTIYSDLNASGFNLPFDVQKHVAIYGNRTFVDGVCYENIKMADLLNALTKTVEPKNITIDKPIIGYKQKPEANTSITSDYIYPRIQEFLKENDIVIAETGMVPHGIAQIKFPESANVEFQTLWGSIGWATPATLGACLAKPQTRVVLVTGEGAHQLTAMEIGNMLRLGLKPTIIVINNKGYTIERLLCNNPNDKFNDIVQMNYTKFARVFDGEIWATKVSTTEDFDKALKVTQIMNKLCYIEIDTVPEDAPMLTIDIANSMKERAQNAKIESSIPQEEKLFNSQAFKESAHKNFSYETVVHSAFLLDDNTEKEVKN